MDGEMIVRRDAVELIPFHGLEVFDYTAGVDASSSLALINVPLDARHPEAYSTKSDKYYFVLEGQIRFGLGSGRSDLGPGDIFKPHWPRAQSPVPDAGTASRHGQGPPCPHQGRSSLC